MSYDVASIVRLDPSPQDAVRGNMFASAGAKVTAGAGAAAAANAALSGAPASGADKIAAIAKAQTPLRRSASAQRLTQAEPGRKRSKYLTVAINSSNEGFRFHMCWTFLSNFCLAILEYCTARILRRISNPRLSR